MGKFKEGDIVRLPKEKRRGGLSGYVDSYSKELIGEKVRVVSEFGGLVGENIEIYEVESLNGEYMDEVYVDEMEAVPVEETVKVLGEGVSEELARLDREIEHSEEMLSHMEDELEHLKERRDQLKWGEG